MPIDWSLAQPKDIVGNALQYYKAGADQLTAQTDRNALQAQRARQEGREVAQDARLERQDSRQVTQDQQKAQTDALATLGQFSQNVRTDADLAALKANPVFQRVYQQAATALGLPAPKMPLEALTLDQIHQFNSKAPQVQGVNLGSGGYGTFDPNSGKFTTLREPTDRPVIIGNGATAIDPDTGEPIYANRKTFAPPRAGAGGGVGVSLPPGYAPR